jgi:hypothetical protein
MSADLHIHVMEGVTTDDLRCFNRHTLTSKYFDVQDLHPCGNNYNCAHDRAVVDSPQVWIGQVSFLKAMLLEDTETYVPGVVQAIVNLIREDEPVIDDALLAGVREAFARNNDTSYSVADVDEVVAYLERYRGKKVFTVSW